MEGTATRTGLPRCGIGYLAYALQSYRPHLVCGWCTGRADVGRVIIFSISSRIVHFLFISQSPNQPALPRTSWPTRERRPDRQSLACWMDRDRMSYTAHTHGETVSCQVRVSRIRVIARQHPDRQTAAHQTEDIFAELQQEKYRCSVVVEGKVIGLQMVAVSRRNLGNHAATR